MQRTVVGQLPLRGRIQTGPAEVVDQIRHRGKSRRIFTGRFEIGDGEFLTVLQVDTSDECRGSRHVNAFITIHFAAGYT